MAQGLYVTLVAIAVLIGIAFVAILIGQAIRAYRYNESYIPFRQNFINMSNCLKQQCKKYCSCTSCKKELQYTDNEAQFEFDDIESSPITNIGYSIDLSPRNTCDTNIKLYQ